MVGSGKVRAGLLGGRVRLAAVALRFAILAGIGHGVPIEAGAQDSTGNPNTDATRLTL